MPFNINFAWLAERKKNYTLKNFVKDLSMFGLVSIVGIILIVWVVKPSNVDTLISVFFVLISLITLPHAITLDQFYRVRKQS